ncbi:MAG: pilus assembly protein PilP [Thauera sp.]|jgi:type IV pilus assembly protein PilP|nr:pilus assembly protein PilP [Thauera sp.]
MFISALALAACSGGEPDDIRSWMQQQAKGMRGAVKPLPEIRPFPLVEYLGAELDDPFRQGRMQVEKVANIALRPNLDRRKEPLEAYPLESLRMVGVLSQGGSNHALVNADQNLHQVRVGSYMGQDYGIVTAISDTAIHLRELIQDPQGDWVENERTLTLQEQQETKK